MDAEMMSFGEWLANELADRDWTQSDLMRAAGLKAGIVSHWVNNTRNPETASCYKIANALGIDPLIVLTRAGHLDPTDTEVERMRKAREIAEVYERANQANEDVKQVAGDIALMLNLGGDAAVAATGDLGVTRIYPREYREQLATQALEELEADDWVAIEAMLESRRRGRHRKE